jgi:hypothetical protein
VRALDILHTRLTDSMAFMHKARWRALWFAVQALLGGERLWLTALGRARPGTARPKHAIKAIDRLVGNVRLHADRHLVYRAIAEMVMRPGSRPVVLVDTVEVSAGWFALVASVPLRGRSFPVCAHATRRVKPRAPALVRYLRDLQKILPDGCRPVLVSDAGFESPWFDAVHAMGWDYVGRVRNNTLLCVDGRWRSNRALHRLATNRARNLGDVAFPKKRPKLRRMVLAKKPTTSHRRRRGRSGRVKRNGTDRRMRQSAREPWLLATSLTCRPSAVVAVFALRMRIEQTFRDAKNYRWGWSMRHCGCRSRQRLDVLLLIGALGLLAQQLVGLAAENLHLHREHQANTERRRRVLSIFVLGSLILRAADERVTAPAIASALSQLGAEASHLPEDRA